MKESYSLCLTENFLVCKIKDKEKLLNKRNELISKCRHENKYYLLNYNWEIFKTQC